MVANELKLAVLMSVYSQDDPSWFNDAIKSIITQTKRPDEFILVKDGPVTKEVEAVINKWTNRNPKLFNVVSLEENNGLGPALMAGLDKTTCHIVARMDADDICRKDRLKTQYDFLTENSDIDLVGSWAGQFADSPENIIFCRKSPTEHKQICRLAKFRNPIEHGSVMFRHSKVLAAKGYKDVEFFEDYHLWVKMLLNGNKMAVIPEILYLFRRTEQVLKRRRGLDYLKKWISLQKTFLDIGFISFPIFFINILVRSFIYFLPMKIFVVLRNFIRI